MIPLNYHHLYYFYVIARSGSITRASQQLLLAQPTVSGQLQELEAALKVKLFDRVKKRLVLTESGRFVLDYAESIFEMGQELQDSLRDQTRQGKVAVQLGVVTGTPRAFGHAMLSQTLRFPGIDQVMLHEEKLEGLIRDLRSHRLDAVLSDRPAGVVEGEFIHHLVAKVPVLFAASPAVSKKYRQFPRDLAGAPLILPTAPSAVYHQIEDQLARWKVKPHLMAQVQDVELARRLAIDGVGIAPLNAYTIRMSQPAGRLTVIPCRPATHLYESLYLVTRPRRWTNPAVQYLLKTFKPTFTGA